MEVIKVSNDEQEMERVMDMCKAWEDHKRSGQIEGRLEGIREGRLEGRLEGIREGRTEGRLEGRTEGLLEATERLNKLNSILISSSRYDDLKRSTEDNEYQTKLLDELVPEMK